VTARERCSLADAALKEVTSGMQQSTAASNIRFFIGVTASQCK
jgi:hypothetical protein